MVFHSSSSSEQWEFEGENEDDDEDDCIPAVSGQSLFQPPREQRRDGEGGQ
jgi:hypothetical protein